MDREKILKFVQPYVKQDKIYRDAFDLIFFEILSDSEIELAESILIESGIEIVDECEPSDYCTEDLNILNRLEEILKSESPKNENDYNIDNCRYTPKNENRSEKNLALCWSIKDDANNQEAKENLCRLNEPLVRKIAYRYAKITEDKLEIEDLIQSGMIGLLKAADKFDPYMGTQFSTYAVWWIWQSITRMILNESSIIRIPVHMVEKLTKVSHIRNSLELKGISREEQENIIAEKLNIPKSVSKKLMLLEWQFANIVSLNRSFSEDDDSNQSSNHELLEFIEDKNADNACDIVMNEELHDKIVEIMHTLNPREASVLNKRFGITCNPMTLEEIGQEFHVTRERIRQIEAKALTRLKHPAKRKELAEFL